MDFKGSHFEKELMLWGVRWYVAYPISYRQLEGMMGERGVAVDHSTLNRQEMRIRCARDGTWSRCGEKALAKDRKQRGFCQISCQLAMPAVEG